VLLLSRAVSAPVFRFAHSVNSRESGVGRWFTWEPPRDVRLAGRSGGALVATVSTAGVEGHLYVSTLYGNVLLFLIKYANVKSSQGPNREPFCELGVVASKYRQSIE
jgi:hypothetical protein